MISIPNYVFRRQLIDVARLRAKPPTPLKVIVQSLSTTRISQTRRKREEEEDITNSISRSHSHDHFSEWKILSGPYDWKNYVSGKEGAKKYRTQNLPITSSPGLYELGVLPIFPTPEPDETHISSRDVIVVYVGQTKNLRVRAQQHGRNGAHLPELFLQIFSKGYAIVYRCAPTRSKRDAEELEDELLREFDYAWNKKRNGDRRINDILVESSARIIRPSLGAVSILNIILEYYYNINNKGICRIWKSIPSQENESIGFHHVDHKDQVKASNPSEHFKLWSYIRKWLSK